MAEIQMPQLGETVTEGTITKWLKAVGEQITEDEAIVEVSTDKVDSEIPSPVSGVLTEIRAAEGDTVEVGAVLAVVGDAAGAPAPPAAEPEAPPAPAAEPAPVAAAAPVVEAAPVPAPPPPPTPAAESAPSPASGAEGLVLSPVVRRLIEEHQIDPASLTGTGIGGRITRDDVLAVVEGRSAPASPAPPAPAPSAPPPAPVAAPPAAPRPAPVVPAVAGEASTAVPFNNIRRRTGEHMVRSKAASPHVYTVMEADMEAVDRVRRAHKEAFRAETGVNLTYLPFITRALVDALAEFPHMNASVGEGELVVHHEINVGFAVDLGYEGLIVPVVHGAGDLRLPALARAIADVADRARARTLSADDISGGTVTITNPGASGTLVQLPVINQPQVMILSTEGVNRRPVVVTDASGGESLAIRSVGNLSMAWDHRAFDGAYAAAFLRRLVDILETRDWEAEL